MREIKFRGKRPNSGKWIYGYLYEDGIYSYILHPEYFKSAECSCEVVTETVGQYTGLKDKNEKEIYEGDIVKIEVEAANGNYFIERPVRWDNDKVGFIRCSEKYEVIGNIHDNLELI